jgi:glyoxylase-like metal-dependent hydrolase (beta-lactamase superfamily II)
MKKTLKRILLVACIVLILLAGILFLNNLPILLMNPAETGQILNTNIYAVKDAFVTVYFIKTESGYILFDAGVYPNKLEETLKKIKIDANDVKWVFLTHSDGDHVAALPLFPNAKIYMCDDELLLLNGTTKRNVFGGNQMPAGIDIDEIILLSDGQKISLNGIDLECIKAPGHTIGSMMYLVGGKYLFTGDAFKIKNGNKSVHLFSMDKELAKKTIEQLRETIDSSLIVLTSHYGLHNNGVN